MKIVYIPCLLILSMAWAHSASVVINEIMYNPPTGNQAEEFIELFNPSAEPVDLSSWSFSQGIHYSFPNGTILNASSYLLLSASPEAFFNLYKFMPFGGYAGQLSNDGEEIVLIDSSGEIADRVEYQEEEGWPQTADGWGSSLERIHPEMRGDRFESWRASAYWGSPIFPNATAVAAPAPIVEFLKQIPATPSSSDEVSLSVRTYHSKAVSSVGVFYKTEYETTFHYAPMTKVDPSVLSASNGNVYSGTITAHGNGDIVEFRILALDEMRSEGWFPLDPAGPAAIYRVDDAAPQSELPVYRIIMRRDDEVELRTRHPGSNDALPASFVYEGDIYHNVSVRFRGKGSRWREPKSYRVDFTDARHFGSIRKLNLNAFNVDRQFIGLECFRLLGLPAPQAKFVGVDFNGAFIPQYVQVERTGKQMMERLFGESEGNLYRGIEQANLDYRGEEFDAYWHHYIKETNERAADFSDIVRLCDAFSLGSQDAFVERIKERIDLNQWVRWFALKQVLNDREGGLSLERGDDYFLYRPLSQKRFFLLPWDLDSVLVEPFEPVHHHGTPAVQRLLRHPDIAGLYYQELLQILDVELPLPLMKSIIDRAAPVSDQARRDELLALHEGMREFIRSQIPQRFTAEINEGQGLPVTLIDDGYPMKFFRGRQEPPGLTLDWKDTAYNDVIWETGIGSVGYGDGDDQTLLVDMENQYGSVFVRIPFQYDPAHPLVHLNFSVLYDDGFIAYLNGQEILRENVTGIPFHNKHADGNHESEVYEAYSLDSALPLLRDGQNMLALFGANVSEGSSDFSLGVKLDGTAADENRLLISGSANAVGTRFIEINGERCQYEPWLGEWSCVFEPHDGRNEIDIRALGPAGEIVDSTQIIHYHNAEPPVSIIDWRLH